MKRRIGWKGALTFVLTLALVMGILPANIGGILPEGTVMVAQAAEEEREIFETTAGDGGAYTYVGTHFKIETDISEAEGFYLFNDDGYGNCTISALDNVVITRLIFDRGFYSGGGTPVLCNNPAELTIDGGSFTFTNVNTSSVKVTCADDVNPSCQIRRVFVYYKDLKGADRFNILSDTNPTWQLDANINGDVTITRDDGVIDLNGHTINGTLLPQNNDPNKTLVVKNGVINNVDGAYGFDRLFSGNIVFENVTIPGNLWTDGHNITINSGTYNNILCYKALNASSSLTINGGTFNGTLTNGGSVLFGYYVEDHGQYNIAITGGTFSFNPSEYVVAGYIAAKDGNTWKVIGVENKVTAKAPTVLATGNVEYYVGSDGKYYVLDSDGYREIEENSWIIPSLLSQFNASTEVNPTLTFTENESGNLTVTRDDGVIDLNGRTLSGNLMLQNNNPDKTLTIKNGTVTGEIDGAPLWNDYYKGKIVLENVTANGTIWTDGHEYTFKSGTYGGTIYALKDSVTTGKIIITGGTFNNSLVVGFNDWGQNVAGGTFSISGGAFAQKPATAFLAEGCYVLWNGSKYVVYSDGLTEVTSKLTNPGFENGTTGWEFKASDDSGARDTNNATYKMSGSEGNKLFNIWSRGWSVHQTAKGLSNGKYKLTAVVASTNGNKVALRANGITSQVNTTGDPNGIFIAVEFYVTDGTATIGAEGVNNVYFKCDDFRLFYIDDSQPEPSPREENDYTDYIKNPDFEYGSGYGWTYDNSANTNEIGVFYTVSPYTITGHSGNYIFNSWYTGEKGKPISQTVTGLPNGRYQLVAVTGPANGVVIKGNGQASKAGAEGEMTVEFDVTDGTAVIGAEGVNDSWFKVDNFRLYRLGELIQYEKVEAKDATYFEDGNTEYYIGTNGKYYILDGDKYVEIEENSWVIPRLTMTPAMNVTSDSSKLNMNVYVPIADGYSLDDYSVTFGGVSQTLTETIVGEQSYGVFTVTCAAKEMADLKALVISADNGEIYRNDSLSAATYLNSIINNAAYSAYHDMAKAMLRYGGAAQTYFVYNTGNLANAGIEGYGLDSLDAISLANTSPTADQLKAALAFEKSEYYAMNMSFTSDTSMMIAFKIKSGATAEEAISELQTGLTSSVFGNITYAADGSGKYVIVKVVNIPIKRLNETIFSMGGLEIKAADYLSKVVNNESANANLKNLCKALFAFYQSATAE